MDPNNPCIFCNREHQKFLLIAENDFAIARYDEFPISLGHALIIPRRHSVSFFDLMPEEVGKLFSLMKIAREKIIAEYNPDGFNIGVNDGVAAGRTMHHVHMHLIPRYTGDLENPQGGIRNIFPGKGNYPN